jgi:hypothetical protein
MTTVDELMALAGAWAKACMDAPEFNCYDVKAQGRIDATREALRTAIEQALKDARRDGFEAGLIADRTGEVL